MSAARESRAEHGGREGGSRCLSWLLAALLFGFASSARADVPLEWLGRRVVAVEIVGAEAHRLDPASLGIAKGAPLTRTLLRDTIERLGRAGRWADVQIDAALEGGGVVLFVHLAPRLVAFRVDIVGNDVLDERELTRVVGVREEGEIEVEQFPGIQHAILELYAERGYHEARVDIVLRDTNDPARKVVRVGIDEGAPTYIKSIAFVGEQLPRRKGLRRVLGFEPGDVLDLPHIREGLTRMEDVLRRAGYYDAELSEPVVERKGRSARLQVPSRVGPRFEVRFWGNGPLSESELFAAMQLGEERLAGEANLRALEQKLTDSYRRYGFRDAVVRITARSEQREFESKVTGQRYEEPTVVLDVSIETGAQTEIEQITFPGAEHFTNEFLREQVFSYLEEDLPGSSVQRPVDSQVADGLGFGGGGPDTQREVKKPIVQDPRRLFYERTYEEAMEHLRELYRGDGYLDVKVGPVELKPLAELGLFVAVIPIDEGPRTFVYELVAEGNTQLSTRELLDAAGLVRGAPFSYVKLEEARLRIVELYQEHGFFYARVEPLLRTSEDGTRVEIIFQVEEGYVVRVGDIIVRGNERSNASMINNRVRLKSGDVYRPSVARATQDALLTLDVFTSVTVSPEDPDLPARVKNVVVSVTERKNQWLGWSAGFSTGEGVRGGFEYGYRNLLGSALHASFRGQLSYQFVFLDAELQRRYESLSTAERIEYQTTLTLGIPYIPHLPKNVATIDLTVLSDIQRDFRIQKESVVGTVFYRPVRRLTFTVAEELEASDFNLLAEGLTRSATISPSNLVPDGQNTLVATQLTAALDLRDRAYNPRKGILVSLSPEYDRTLTSKAGEVADIEKNGVPFKSNMLRLLGSFAFYVPLAPKLTFASQWRYGRIVHLEQGSSPYPNRLFYLGGTNFRGYQINQLVPQDIRDLKSYDPNNIVSHGGQVFLAGQNELRFPIVGDLYGGLFTDIGNLWAKPWKFDITRLIPVFGAGLRFQTPVASLAFDYGVRAIYTNPFRVVGAFQFAFQTF